MKKMVVGYFVLLVVFFLATMAARAAMAAEVYEIDEASRYISLADHFMVVDLDDDITVGILMKKGTDFSTPEMYQISRGFDVCSENVYRQCVQQRTAMGKNAATLIIRRLNEEIAVIKADYRKAKEERKRNPDLVDYIGRVLDHTAKRESGHLIEDLARDAVDHIIWKNRRW